MKLLVISKNEPKIPLKNLPPRVAWIKINPEENPWEEMERIIKEIEKITGGKFHGRRIYNRYVRFYVPGQELWHFYFPENDIVSQLLLTHFSATQGLITTLVKSEKTEKTIWF